MALVDRLEKHCALRVNSVASREPRMTRFWKFRMWLACKIIGKRTNFMYQANILSDGGVFYTPGYLAFQKDCIYGAASDIRKYRLPLPKRHTIDLDKQPNT